MPNLLIVTKKLTFHYMLEEWKKSRNKCVSTRLTCLVLNACLLFYIIDEKCLVVFHKDLQKCELNFLINSLYTLFFFTDF